VFVDVGNKSFGLEALMKHLGLQPSGVLHVGDRRAPRRPPPPCPYGACRASGARPAPRAA